MSLVASIILLPNSDINGRPLHQVQLVSKETVSKETVAKVSVVVIGEYFIFLDAAGRLATMMMMMMMMMNTTISTAP